MPRSLIRNLSVPKKSKGESCVTRNNELREQKTLFGQLSTFAKGNNVSSRRMKPLFSSIHNRASIGSEADLGRNL